MNQKREEKVKQLRILRLDEEIRSGKYPNSTTLSKKFEVSRATIMRDLEFLRDQYEAPLEYDSTKNGYYYSDPTFFIQSVMLSEGELFTVSTIMPLLEQYKNTPLENSFKKIMGKVSQLLPDQVSVDAAFINEEVKFISDPLPAIDSEIFETIFKAVKLHKTISFYYRSISKQDYAFRTINPYHVICQKGNWYLLGYSHNAEEVRVFTLSRMKNLKLENENFSLPENFKIEDYIDPAFGIWNNNKPPVKIELLFTKDVNTYILERTWHATQECYQNEDGSVYLSFETNQLQEIQHWVLQFGGNVKVLNPPELHQAVLDEARKILAAN